MIMFTNNSINLLDIRIDDKPLSNVVGEAIDVILTKDTSQIIFACVNPHSIIVAQKDVPYRTALDNAHQVVADGVGVTLFSKLARLPILHRITGTDYFFSLLTDLNNRGKGRIYFFGSSHKVLSRIVKKFNSQFPNLELCGMCSPPFREWSETENDKMIDDIKNAKPDVLWVGMTAPKQEKWVEANKHKLNVPVIGSIGAVFDFYADTYPRAPQWMCNLGIEWLFRLIKEPRRMWRRNFISTPKFIALVFWKHVLRFNK